jgi:hypothetical protein
LGACATTNNTVNTANAADRISMLFCSMGSGGGETEKWDCPTPGTRNPIGEQTGHSRRLQL